MIQKCSFPLSCTFTRCTASFWGVPCQQLLSFTNPLSWKDVYNGRIVDGIVHTDALSRFLSNLIFLARCIQLVLISIHILIYRARWQPKHLLLQRQKRLWDLHFNKRSEVGLGFRFLYIIIRFSRHCSANSNCLKHTKPNHTNILDKDMPSIENSHEWFSPSSLNLTWSLHASMTALSRYFAVQPCSLSGVCSLCNSSEFRWKCSI